jgi:hypothetical protein
MPRDPKAYPPDQWSWCDPCQQHVRISTFSFHVRSSSHQEAEATWKEELKRKREAPKPPRTPSPHEVSFTLGELSGALAARRLREEVLSTAAALEADELSHTDVASWLLNIARRLQGK